MAIYVKFAKKKKPRTVLEFLDKFYNKAVYSNTYLRASVTFFDKECKKVQCDRVSRSFDDLLIMINTYYPSIKPLKLMHYLLIFRKNLPTGIQVKPYLGFCGGMQRIKYLPYQQTNYPNDIDRKMSKSKYTWEELLKPLGIKNRKDFEDYINNN